MRDDTRSGRGQWSQRVEAIHLKAGKGVSSGIFQPGDMSGIESEIVGEGLKGDGPYEIHYLSGLGVLGIDDSNN